MQYVHFAVRSYVVPIGKFALGNFDYSEKGLIVLVDAAWRLVVVALRVPDGFVVFESCLE